MIKILFTIILIFISFCVVKTMDTATKINDRVFHIENSIDRIADAFDLYNQKRFTE
jgi:hypothetical protein